MLIGKAHDELILGYGRPREHASLADVAVLTRSKCNDLDQLSVKNRNLPLIL